MCFDDNILYFIILQNKYFTMNNIFILLVLKTKTKN